MKNDIKKVVVLSNYFNHHQKPFSDEMYARLGDGFLFIETEPMAEERKSLGWGMASYPDYVVSAEKLAANRDKYVRLINEADVLLTGSAPEEYVAERKKNGGLIFRVSERALKEGFEPLKYLPRLVKWNLKNMPRKNIYMLCSSAYAAGDYAKFGLFRGRCYKWGYFTELRQYDDLDALLDRKKKNSLLWVARLIELKHPERALMTAARLHKEGYDVTLTLVGNGPLDKAISDQAESLGISDRVHLVGAVTPERVREYMEESEVFMFTSDRNEGWGAVLVEAMNSGCAVVSDEIIGASPFLISNGENGFTYPDGNTEVLYERTRELLADSELRRRMAKAAYATIRDQWNAKNAAERFLTLASQIAEGGKGAVPYTDGVCSPSK